MQLMTRTKYRSLWKDRRFLLSVLTGLLILAAGLECSELARHHLQHTLRGQWEPDLLLDHLPVMELEYFLVWGLELLLGFLVVIMLFYPEYLPFSLKTIGLLYLIRSFFIILTPLGARPDKVVAPVEELFYNMAYGSNEFFFSGHVSFPFMLALIFWHRPLIRYVLLFATFLFAVAVLLAHTHYSIDVFAVFFMAPTIFGLSRTLFHNDVLYTKETYTTKNTRHIPPIL